MFDISQTKINKFIIDKLNNKNENELFETFISFIVQLQLKKKVNKKNNNKINYLFLSAPFSKNKNISTSSISEISISTPFTRNLSFFVSTILFLNQSSAISQ